MIKNPYTSDSIRAVDARREAQKIAFGPLVFQAVLALRELGILEEIAGAGETGLTRGEAAERTGLPLYGVSVLAGMALETSVLKIRADTAGGSTAEERLVLGKTGWFLLEDEMTVTNLNFVNDICYKGACLLAESVKTGKPEGLKSFGESWTTIYEAAPSLPEKERKSWFAFNHFYSDIAFPEALPVVLKNKPRLLLDIGGNTARWAILCCRHDPDVQVTIVELPGPAAVAEKNAAAAGFSGRISTFVCDLLDGETRLPSGADAVFMSQFLTAFSLSQITRVLARIHAAVTGKTDIYVLDPLLDKQRFEAASYVLRATALYFTCMANGRSSFYHSDEYIKAIEDGGFTLQSVDHSLRWNGCSLLHFRKKT